MIWMIGAVAAARAELAPRDNYLEANPISEHKQVGVNIEIGGDVS